MKEKMSRQKYKRGFYFKSEPTDKNAVHCGEESHFFLQKKHNVQHSAASPDLAVTKKSSVEIKWS